MNGGALGFSVDVDVAEAVFRLQDFYSLASNVSFIAGGRCNIWQTLTGSRSGIAIGIARPWNGPITWRKA